MVGMEKPTTQENKREKQEYHKLLEQVKELEAIRDQLLRSAADYDNARKRLAKEREEFIKFSQEKLMRELLPILDNFERALAHGDESSPSSTPSQPVVAGIQLIWKQFLTVLATHGLKRLTSEGRPFDPHFHEVVDQVEEEGPEGIITKEILPGYLLHDRLLRPAKVRILVRTKKAGEKTEEKEEEIT